MLFRNLLVLVLGFALPAAGLCQGVIRRIAFGGPYYLQPTDDVLLTRYDEGGLVFTPLPGDVGFGCNGGAVPNSPHNGGAYIDSAYTTSLSAVALSGSHFGLISVDLAEYSSVVSGPKTVQFLGYKADGSTVAASFTTDGVMGDNIIPDFETFAFDSRFADIVRMDVPGYGWSLDNLVINYGVPEPSVPGLLVVGWLSKGVLSRRSRRRSSNWWPLP
jgi:hypothetical protein